MPWLFWVAFSMFFYCMIIHRDRLRRCCDRDELETELEDVMMQVVDGMVVAAGDEATEPDKAVVDGTVFESESSDVGFAGGFFIPSTSTGGDEDTHAAGSTDGPAGGAGYEEV